MILTRSVELVRKLPSQIRGLPALRCQNARCFDHLISCFFNTPSYFQHFSLLYFSTFFHWIPAFLKPPFSLKKYCVPALNTRKAEGNCLIRTHISTVFQHGACVSKCCIPALPAPLSSNPSPLKNVRCYCILAWTPRKNTNLVAGLMPGTV